MFKNILRSLLAFCSVYALLIAQLSYGSGTEKTKTSKVKKAGKVSSQVIKGAAKVAVVTKVTKTAINKVISPLLDAFAGIYLLPEHAESMSAAYKNDISKLSEMAAATHNTFDSPLWDSPVWKQTVAWLSFTGGIISLVEKGKAAIHYGSKKDYIATTLQLVTVGVAATAVAGVSIPASGALGIALTSSNLASSYYPRTVTKLAGVKLSKGSLAYSGVYYYPGHVKRRAKTGDPVPLGKRWTEVKWSNSYLGCSYKNSTLAVDYNFYAEKENIEKFLFHLSSNGYFNSTDGNNNDLLRHGTYYPESLYFYRRKVGNGRFKEEKHKNYFTLNYTKPKKFSSTSYLRIQGKWQFDHKKKTYSFATFANPSFLKVSCLINIFVKLLNHPKYILNEIPRDHFIKNVDYYVKDNRFAQKSPVIPYVHVKKSLLTSDGQEKLNYIVVRLNGPNAPVRVSRTSSLSTVMDIEQKKAETPSAPDPPEIIQGID